MADLERLKSALSSIHWNFEFYEKSIDPWRLIPLLEATFPSINPETWKDRLDWGGVYVNGRMKTHDIELPCPCQLEYFEPKYNFEERFKAYPEFSKSWVLHEDEDLIVVFKPVGLPCLPSREQRHLHLKGFIENYLKQRVHMPSRLDTATSGILIMSKSARMNKAIQQAFEFRRVSKYYLFETASIPDWNQRLVNESIGKDREHPILRKTNGENAKEAKTLFETVCFSSVTDDKGKLHDTILIMAKPLTGRTHQIRTHCSHIGIPIIGDNFYGGLNSSSFHLISYKLEFFHPFEKRLVTVGLPEQL
ncbi:MAG: RluA family pseudouridine synthase, partial [SAR324 cluster bacterium]|nr:RluA family pseudouridine synthase [SAR324 cluster bacterium]